MKYFHALVFITLLAGCATSDTYKTSNLFCKNLSEYAASVPAGQRREVILRVGGRWLVDHYKVCENGSDEASANFCNWLYEHSSTEFMEANVNTAMSCLQGHTIVGFIGNTGVESWTGKAKFYNPHLGVDDVSVTLEYNVTYFEEEIDEDFMKIVVEAE